MSILTLLILYLSTLNCLGIRLIDLPDSSDSESEQKVIKRRNLNSGVTSKLTTKHWLFRQSEMMAGGAHGYEDEKDMNIKTKISALVQQTIHDTERKLQSVQALKEHNREFIPYRIGFILSLVKKTREVLNELFNVAVRHRDSWKALEQLKIFEMIVHTNVDTTNLVRQLVELHIQHINSTSPGGERRVVLLKK